jgi:PIN domain nuclease of toxin-antitoxin system
MRLLLDTHVVYWAFYETAQLSQRARDWISDATEIFISSASIWEIAIKVRLGKMGGNPHELIGMIRAADFEELPVLSRHAAMVADLPLHHADPFDRLLVAQAQAEGLHLLTADTKLKLYSELVVCV